MNVRKNDREDLPGPVVVGGVGGSGTRVIAEILHTFGFYLGEDLNVAGDNLTYTFLFKRPRWFYRNKKNYRNIRTGLNVFHKIMKKRRLFTISEILFFLNASFSQVFYGHNHTGKGRKLRPALRIQKIFAAEKNTETKYVGWGWKEPNSFLFINHLNEKYHNLKYIHMIRHGLDMAFSSNQNQLFNWGPLYGVDRPASSSKIPSAAFEYWIKANQKMLSAGEKLGPEKFLKINFEQLCNFPDIEIKRMIDFLNINPKDEIFRRALKLPRKPKSVGRYRNYDLSQFGLNGLDLLSGFGYSVED
jgi:hypothetical protein